MRITGYSPSALAVDAVPDAELAEAALELDDAPPQPASVVTAKTAHMPHTAILCANFFICLASFLFGTDAFGGPLPP